MAYTLGREIRLPQILITRMSFPPSKDYVPTMARVRKFFLKQRTRFVCLLVGAILTSGFAALLWHSKLKNGIAGILQVSGSTYTGTNRWGYHDNEGANLAFLVFLTVASIFLWYRVFVVGRSLYRTRSVAYLQSIEKQKKPNKPRHRTGVNVLL